MNRWEALKAMPLDAAAQAIVFDDEGNERSVCGVCQRYVEGNCDDRCYLGVKEYLTMDVAG